MRYTVLLKVSFLLTLFITLYFTVVSSVGDNMTIQKIDKILKRELSVDYKIENFHFENSRIEFFLNIENRRVGRIEGRISIFRFSILSKFEVKDFKSSWIKRFNDIGQLSGKGEINISPLGIEINGNINRKDEIFNAKYRKSFISRNEYLKWDNSSVAIDTVSKLFKLNWINGFSGLLEGSGDISGDLSEIDEIEGNISVETVGTVSRERVVKFLNIEGRFPEKIPFSILGDIKLDDGDIYSFSMLNSELFSAKAEKIFYNCDKNYLKSDLFIRFDSLEKVGEFLDRDLLGTLDIKGEVELENRKLSFGGYSDKLKGKILFEAENDTTHYRVEKVLFDKVLTLLKIYPYVHGESSFDIVRNSRGEMKIEGSVSELSVENNFVLNQLNKIFDLHIENRLFKNIEFSGKGDKELFQFDMNLTHQNASFQLNNSYVDSQKSRLKAPLLIFQKNRKIAEILLYGDIENPYIELRVTRENIDKVKKFIRAESRESGYLKEIDILLELFGNE